MHIFYVLLSLCILDKTGNFCCWFCSRPPDRWFSVWCLLACAFSSLVCNCVGFGFFVATCGKYSRLGQKDANASKRQKLRKTVVYTVLNVSLTVLNVVLPQQNVGIYTFCFFEENCRNSLFVGNMVWKSCIILLLYSVPCFVEVSVSTVPQYSKKWHFQIFIFMGVGFFVILTTTTVFTSARCYWGIK